MTHPDRLRLIQRWLVPLSLRTGRPSMQLLSQGLQVSDFSEERVAVQYEDDSVALYRNAFALQHPEMPGKVAVFTEHCGYLELELPDTAQLIDLASAENQEVRSAASAHCVPFLPCPLCGADGHCVARGKR